MNIGNKIKEYREINNISQEELADKLFVSRQTVSNWETNKYYPDIKSISILCNIFDISIDDFINPDIEEIKRVVDNIDMRKFKTLSWIFTFELFFLIISAYYLLDFTHIIRVVILCILFIVTLITAFIIEKYKKQYNIQTYKEIIAFYENKTLSHDEKNIELGKRPYQKILLAICSALVTMAVMVLLHLLIG